MAKSMSNVKVEINDLTDFVAKNISDKKEITKFYYYWMNLNIVYDFEKRDKWRTEKATDKEIDDSENPLLVFKEKKLFVLDILVFIKCLWILRALNA